MMMMFPGSANPPKNWQFLEECRCPLNKVWGDLFLVRTGPEEWSLTLAYSDNSWDTGDYASYPSSSWLEVMTSRRFQPMMDAVRRHYRIRITVEPL